MNASEDQRPKVIIDVGASQGSFALHAARLNPLHSVLAIEPNPKQAALIREGIKSEGLPNITVMETAVDSVSGSKTFHLERGKTPNEGSLIAPQGAQGPIDTFSVQALTLASIIDESQIVEFLKVDAQGKDLDVLASAGDKLAQIRQGVLEVCATAIGRAYYDEPVLLDALKFLEANNLTVYRISSNDLEGRYVNVYWAQSDFDWRAQEESLHLNQIPLYSVGRYWHVPTAFPLDSYAAWLRAIYKRLAGKPIL
jgi:FkbM family methyltransferase